MGSATIEIQGEKVEVSVDPSQAVEAQVDGGDGTIYVSVASYRGKIAEMTHLSHSLWHHNHQHQSLRCIPLLVSQQKESVAAKP
jgi:hypothetical protein